VKIAVVDAETTRELRRAVLRPAWPVGSRMHGDDDPHALHIAALDDDLLVGACVLIAAAYPLHPDLADAWQLRGMATDEAHRNLGIGAAMLDVAVSEVLRRGGRLIWCQARELAIAFYGRHGFVGEGEYFTHHETGIVHQLMYRELSGDIDSSHHMS
jgi:ribosomal protein S18 acetylase RimI-like enzyme